MGEWLLDEWDFAAGNDMGCLGKAVRVTLPHTWNTREQLQNWHGRGWYRTKLPPCEEGEKRTFVYFRGVYRDAEVYVGDRPVLKHEGSAYTPFGGEITRGMPPGHFNVSFVDSDTKIGEEEDKFEDHFEGMVAGLKEARKQGAFMVWNHPHWSRQAPNGPVWYDEHSRILDMGLMHGLEVFNQFDGFSKEVFHWAMQKNLTIVSGTDAHKLMELWIDYGNGELRPCTLVFAKEKSEAGIREALDNHRTAVLAQHKVYPPGQVGQEYGQEADHRSAQLQLRSGHPQQGFRLRGPWLHA